MAITDNVVETFQTCVKSKDPYENEEEKEKCKRMVEDLPPDAGLETIAACTSYAFWYLSQDAATRPDEETQARMAMREARRHLVYMNGDYDKAIASFQECLEYRKEHRLDLLKTCFSPSFVPKDEGDLEQSQKIAKLVQEDMNNQKVIMRARDKEDRAIMTKFARYESGSSEDSYIWSQVYMAERSVAATEFGTLGAQERTVSIFDYHGFEASKSPPVATQLKAAQLLQKLYPERLQQLIILEPPFWLRGVLAVLKPVISAGIIDRIEMATGAEATGNVIDQIVDAEQKALLLTSEERLHTAVSMEHFLIDVPFYALYDDIECHREIPQPPQAGTESAESDGNNSGEGGEESSLSAIAGSASSYLKSFW